MLMLEAFPLVQPFQKLFHPSSSRSRVAALSNEGVGDCRSSATSRQVVESGEELVGVVVSAILGSVEEVVLGHGGKGHSEGHAVVGPPDDVRSGAGDSVVFVPVNSDPDIAEFECAVVGDVGKGETVPAVKLSDIANAIQHLVNVGVLADDRLSCGLGNDSRGDSHVVVGEVDERSRGASDFEA